MVDYDPNHRKVQELIKRTQTPRYNDSKEHEDVNVLALMKGEDCYIFLYGNEDKASCLRYLGKYAAHPELNMNWYDAAVLSQKVRNA